MFVYVYGGELGQLAQAPDGVTAGGSAGTVEGATEGPEARGCFGAGGG